MTSLKRLDYFPRLFLGFILSIILLIVTILLGYKNSNDLEGSFSLVEHTYSVIQSLDNIEIKCRETEGLVRGYIAHGDSAITLKLEQNLNIINVEMKELGGLISDNPLQKRRFEALQLLVNRMEELFNEIIQFENRSPKDHIQKITEKIKTFRFIKNKMEAEEKKLLNERQIAAYIDLKTTNISISIAGGIAVLMGLIGIIVINKDIKRRKKTEEDLKLMNENKNKFFSIISHDLKSPLNSMNGLMQILIAAREKKSWQEADEVIQMLRTSSAKASELLANLLEWSLSQMNKVIINKEYFDVYLACQHVSDVMGHVATGKSILIENEVPTGTIVFADRNMIETVLRNLISNAIKFTRPGGRIIVSAKKLKREVEIIVKDSGVGMTKEMIGNILQMETRHTTKGTAREEGTGLGLLISKDFIEKNGGRLEIKSELNKGSEFIFYLMKYE